MPSHLAALAFGVTLIAAAPGSVPNFDARPGCLAGADSGFDIQPNVSACVQSEQQAKDELINDWQKFSRTDKNQCVAEIRIGGPPSYIELLTCLEMERDAHSMDIY
jgi:hypothetical protein